MYKYCLGLVFLLALSHIVQAQVYKCENDAGEINFSDEPCSKGERSERLNWLKGTASGKKNKKKSVNYSVSTQAKKTSKKAKKNNEAFVLLSLLTTTQLELETVTLRSTLNGESSDAPELILSDGIIVDLLRVKKIIITHNYGKSRIQIRFIMDDGYEEVKTIKAPYPVISGAAKIGRFSKSLLDIKQIEFFNSKILLSHAHKKTLKNKSAIGKKVPVEKIPPQSTLTSNKETPVIELDLSQQTPSGKAQTNTQAKTTAKTKTLAKKPKVKVTDTKPTGLTKSTGIQVEFTNKKKVNLQHDNLASSKGDKNSRAKYFILSDKEQIAYTDIKTIKIRPTSNQLLVAVELKTKEIKMEVMSKPFTRVVGKSNSGKFDHSLSEIKSISFQR